MGSATKKKVYETITNLRAVCRHAGANNVAALSDWQVLHYARLVTGMNIIGIASDGSYVKPTTDARQLKREGWRIDGLQRCFTNVDR